MDLIFGLQLDNTPLPRPDAESGIHYCGPKKLLALLEMHLGLTGHPDNMDYLRIEQYRQALLLHLAAAAATGEKPFYARSFAADQFATATELLERRDNLRLAGWDFLKQPDTPARLAVLADLEAFFSNPTADQPEALQLSPGFACRLATVIEHLGHRPGPFSRVRLNEPLELLPFHFRRLFGAMHIPIGPCPGLPAPVQPATDLQRFQQRLLAGNGQVQKHHLANDGSLLLVRAKRSNEAAAWLAQLVRLNGLGGAAGSGVSLLLPEKNRTLEIALILEGQPSLGMLSASLARPTLQILKLIPVFLWEPVNPFKILEFVSLSLKPLADGLASLIAQQVAATPGLQGEGWYAMVNRYFEELAQSESMATVNEQRKQYNFWFERRRYDMGNTVPKGDVLSIFDYLRQWAHDAFEESGSKNQSLLVLSGQARRIVELLEALPEQQLTFLELERIVRTIYEPSPVVFQEREVGSFPFADHPGAFAGPVDEVWWWDFVHRDSGHFFARWYGHERAYLSSLGIETDTPAVENARLRWQQCRPVLVAKQRLMLVLPDAVDGEAVNPHPLFGDLQAAFHSLEPVTHWVTLGNPLLPQAQETVSPFAKHFTLPEMVEVKVRQLGKPAAFLHVRNLDRLVRPHETITSLETLFYYPYQWVFRYQIRLNKSSILSVVPDNTLMGNLAHRVFEKLMKEDIHTLDKPSLEQWVERETRRLLAREGAVLLMYGREPDRVAFVSRLKFAAWSLISHIRDNGWQVLGTEQPLDGVFPVSDTAQRTPIKGVADLVLVRGGELAVVDVKWRGAARRESMLRNGEDLQLVLYSRMLSQPGEWAHTAYFIIENGRMLSRNNLAFKNITPLAPTADHRQLNAEILDKMEATWQWRLAQLSNGTIEIRCRQTLMDIEDAYAGTENAQLMEQILEMKSEDAHFDDYRTLINLIV